MKGNSVTLFDECKEVGSRNIERTDTPIDDNGVVFIGKNIEGNEFFEVYIYTLSVILRLKTLIC